MAHRASKRPRASVIMAVHDAEAHLSRAVESALTPDAADVQVVIVDCASGDRTAGLAARMAERDIRIDTACIEIADPASGLDVGMGLARGAYCLFMGQDDWFGPHGIEPLLDLAERAGLDLVVPSVSVDVLRIGGERTSTMRQFDLGISESAGEFRRRAHGLIESGVFDTVRGKLLRFERVSALGLSSMARRRELDFLVSYAESLARAGSSREACYHLTLSGGARAGFDARRFVCCQRDHEQLLDLADRWGMQRSRELMAAVHRRHLSGVVACIENACAGGRLLSTMERNACIRDMLEDRATGESLAALESRNRDFGFMCAPLTRRNVAACCMGVRLVGFMRSARLPLAPLLRDANVAWESLFCVTGGERRDGRQGHLEGDRA